MEGQVFFREEDSSIYLQVSLPCMKNNLASILRTQTTQGIWIATGIGIEPFTIAIDVEGSDSRERGQVLILLIICVKINASLSNFHFKVTYIINHYIMILLIIYV